MVYKTPTSLYIHIPFCAQKCAYCDFVSFAVNDNFRNAYLETLSQEIEMIGEQYKRPALKTIFVGGGTPSLLKGLEIEKLGQAIKKSFQMDQLVEFSIEANPGTLEKEALNEWQKIGVNRISMGVQSMNNELLKQLGRIHTVEMVEASFKLLRENGFENINLDIMFGLPGQKIKDFMETVEAVIRLNPEHISAYSLKIEEGTPFDRLYDSGVLELPTEEEDREMYHALIKRLRAYGYGQYEISNFAKEGYSCQHNLVYWNGESYFAAGLAAHGFIGGVRAGNYSDWENYRQAIEKKQWPIQSREPVDKIDAEFEYIMLRLRLNEGLSFKAYAVQFGCSFKERYKHILEEETRKGTIEETETHVKLTAYGRDIANTVIAEFLPENE